MNARQLLQAFATAVLLEFTSSGCNRTKPPTDPRATRVANRANEPNLASVPPAVNQPVDVNPGVVVFDPVAQPGTDNSFGIGCSRWLALSLGGVNELGRTPGWYLVNRLRKELKWPTLAVSPSDAKLLTAHSGATHVVCGSFLASPSPSLTYQVYEADSGKAVGSPQTVTGSQEDIGRQLPALARKLAAVLKVNNPSIPDATGASGGELETLGRHAYFEDPSCFLPQDHPLAPLARRVPAAALIVLYAEGTRDRAAMDALQNRLIDALPDNGMARLASVQAGPSAVTQRIQQFVTGATKHPDSYLWANALANLQSEAGQLDSALASAARATTISPRNPDGWHSLSGAYGSRANLLRHGRSVSRIAEAEMSYFQQLYGEEVAASKTATGLEPDNPQAWVDLSQAAAFAGDMSLADSAISKAMNLENADFNVLSWALELYQEKWAGDPAKLQQVAQMAADAPYKVPSHRAQAAEALHQLGMTDLTRSAAQRTIRELDALIKKHPDKEPLYLWRYQAYRALEDVPSCVRNYSEAAKRTSISRLERFDFEHALKWMQQLPDVVDFYSKAIKIDPKQSGFHYALGIAYSYKGQPYLQQAIDELSEAVRLNGRDYEAVEQLADLLGRDPSKQAETLEVAKKAVSLCPQRSQNWDQLSSAYAAMSRFAEGIDAANKAIALNPENTRAHSMLGYCYGTRKGPGDIDKAVVQLKEAIRLNPTDASAHVNLGEMFMNKGDKKSAQTEFDETMRLGEESAKKEALRLMEVMKKRP